MKKTLITLLALTSVAGAETPLTLLPNLSTNATRVDGITDGDLGNSSITAAKLAKTLQNDPFPTTGWYWGLDNGDSSFRDDLTIDNSKTGFTIRGRYNYGGEYMLASVNVSDLLVSSTGEYVDSISISFEVTAKSSLTFSAWSWDGTTATEVIAAAAPNNGKNSFTETVALNSDDTLFFVFGSNAGQGAANTITNLTSSYTTAPVPEPTTATLSLLALAGLAARRRRSSR